MLKTLKNAWKVYDLRKKILITLGLLAIFRLGTFIPTPFTDATALEQVLSGGSLGFLDLLSGGGFSRFSIFAMGVTPYINSSIIMSLLTIAIPKLEALSKEGEEGRKKIAEYTRYGTIIFAIIESFGMSMSLRGYGVLTANTWYIIAIIMLTITAGSTFVMWLGEKITEHGLGNGTSLIIFAGIITRFPSMVNSLYVQYAGGNTNIISLTLLFIGFLALIFGIVYMDLGERRIPVQYASKRVGMKSYGGQSSNIPINVNPAGVIAIIFAMSVMQFPMVITNFIASPTSKVKALFETGILSQKSWLYIILYIFLVIFFTWFYTSITFKPEEVADNLQKSGGFIPGLRPGKPTEEYITRIMNRMTMIGGLFSSVIAVAPIIVAKYAKIENLGFSGTAILIMVGVALEINKQMKSQLAMRHYEGFLK